jgi:hypothetical protein
MWIQLALPEKRCVMPLYPKSVNAHVLHYIRSKTATSQMNAEKAKSLGRK